MRSRISSTCLGRAACLRHPRTAQTDPLPSWNDGTAKKAIVDFVQATTVQGSPKFVPPAERIATFDQDGTLCVEHPYTDLTYLPMQEVLEYLRANGYRTYIVTGGGQDFVRAFAEATYGIPPEQVVGSAGGTKYGYGKDGKPFLTKEPKLLLNDNNAGKPESIHLMIGRRPSMAVGNSTGDRQMLEYTKAGDGARLSMIVLHDDAKREYAYGPAQGLANTRVGTFTQKLYDEATKQGWVVISMKSDWNRIFAFE